MTISQLKTVNMLHFNSGWRNVCSIPSPCVIHSFIPIHCPVLILMSADHFLPVTSVCVRCQKAGALGRLCRDSGCVVRSVSAWVVSPIYSCGPVSTPRMDSTCLGTLSSGACALDSAKMQLLNPSWGLCPTLKGSLSGAASAWLRNAVCLGAPCTLSLPQQGK